MKSSIIGSSIRSQSRCLLLLILLPLVVYFNSLSGSFQYDDKKLINRPWIYDLAHYKDELHFLPGPLSNQSLLAVLNLRPVLLFTFAINNTLHYQRVFGFHLVNLLLHVLVTILVFMIVKLSQEFLYLNRSGSYKRETTFRPGTDNDTYSFLILPLTTALFFVLHPLATGSVSYISSRSTLLVSFFYLLSLYVFLRIFTLGTNPYRRTFQVLLAVVIIVLYYLALASKLIAITLPVLLVIWFIFIISPVRFPRFHTFLLSRKMLVVYVLLLIILLMIALNNAGIERGIFSKGGVLYGHFGYFSAQLKIITFHYLKMFLFPINQNVDIGFPFFFGLDLIALLAASILLGIVIWVLLKGSPFLKAGTAWFFLTLAPTSSFLPLGDLAVEHRLYLPMSLGLCLIAGQCVAGMAQLRRLKVLLVLMVAMGVLTTARNRVWLNEMTLWQDAMEKSPHSPRPYNNVGKAYYERNDIEGSMAFFRKSINLSFEFVDAHYNLASVYMDLKRFQDAEEEYRVTIRLDSEYYAAYLGLGSVYNQTGRYEAAIKNYHLANDTWKHHNPGEYTLAKLNLGEVYGKLGRFRDAIRESNLALKFSPSMFKAHFNLGTAYMKLKDLDNAERSFLNCLEMNDQFNKAQFNLARLYQLKKEWEKSNQWFKKFVETKGPNAKAYFGLAWNYQKTNLLGQARDFYAKSLALKPSYLEARINLANVHIQLKQFDEALVNFKQVLQQQPNLFRVNMQMGLLYWKIKNDTTRAENHFRRALELAPRTQDKTQISQLIKALAKS